MAPAFGDLGMSGPHEPTLLLRLEGHVDASSIADGRLYACPDRHIFHALCELPQQGLCELPDTSHVSMPEWASKPSHIHHKSAETCL